VGGHRRAQRNINHSICGEDFALKNGKDDWSSKELGLESLEVWEDRGRHNETSTTAFVGRILH